MKKIIFNLKISLVIFLALSLILTGGLITQQYRSKNQLAVAAGENLASLRQRYAQAGTIFDSTGVILAYSEGGIRNYNSDNTLAEAVLHTLGDYTQRIDNTVETRYQNVLLGNDRNIFHQFYLDIQGKGLSGDDITLTLDSRITSRAAELLGDRSGAIVMINYRTGEIIAAASTPSVAPQSVIDYENIPDTGLFNRALRGEYAPGSVFKLVTTYAWLRSDKYDPEHHVYCNGESTIHPEYANENGDGHGEVDLEAAVSKSCNVFFGELGVILGREELLNAAEQLGVGSGYRAGLLTGITGDIQCKDDDLQLSWLAIGQPTGSSSLSMSPLEIARLTGAIANNGVVMSSQIADHYTDPSGHNYKNMKIEEEKTIMSIQHAETLGKMMLKTVNEGSGSNASVSGYQVAGKTGTVEVKGQANNALFTGYVLDNENPYAVTVIVEEGGSGGGTAAPLAALLLKYALALDK